MLRGIMLVLVALATLVSSSAAVFAQEPDAITSTTVATPSSGPDVARADAPYGGSNCSGVSSNFAEFDPSVLAATAASHSVAVRERLFLDLEPVTVDDPFLSVSANSNQSSDVGFSQISGDDLLQIVGTFEESGIRSFSFEHSSSCISAEDSSVVAEVHDDGTASVTITDAGVVTQTVGVSKPWAIDAEGTTVDTWYEADGSVLTQIVDARGRTGPFTFDPTYSYLSCSGHYSDRDSWFYLDTGISDFAACPVMGMFTAANGYRPVWGFEANVANDYGKIIIRQDGGCNIGPDTGWAWDFQVPCKAHDYCYDLRKASFSGTVSDSDCDDSFYWIMTANCNDRSLAPRLACYDMRNLYVAAVRLPGVVTYPNPQGVEIVNRATNKCADLEGPSSANYTPIQQWSCVGVSNQRWTIWPTAVAGYFKFQTHFSGNKCIRVSSVVYQYPCSDADAWMVFKIQGALNQDQYSIRSWNDPNECWKVPVSYSNGVNLVDPTCNDYSNWWIWRIYEA